MGGRHFVFCLFYWISRGWVVHFPVGVHTPVGLTDVEVPMLMFVTAMLGNELLILL